MKTYCDGFTNVCSHGLRRILKLGTYVAIVLIEARKVLGTSYTDTHAGTQDRKARRFLIYTVSYGTEASITRTFSALITSRTIKKQDESV